MTTDLEPLTPTYRDARQAMVDQQLARRGIADPRVLAAMRKVPREHFVPAFLRANAYEDRPLLIGYEQTISQPYMVALMTEALGLVGHERVLEVGTGSGYQTAVLAELCAEVHTVERIAPLSLRAERALEALGIRNVHFRVGNGADGWPEAAPFDAILVTAGATALPRAFRRQLIEGGRLIIPLGPPGSQVLHRYSLERGDWVDEEMGHVAFVPLVNDRRTGPGRPE